MEADTVKMEEWAEREGGMEMEENGEAKTSYVKTIFFLPAEIIEHIVSYLSLQVRQAASQPGSDT